MHLRRLRAAAGLTQDQLAGRAGLSANAISALERGDRRRASRHTIQSLADALGLAESARQALYASVAPPPDGWTGSGHVPASPAPLIGREADIDAVLRLLADSRLLTLTGPGGVGKTQIAIQV